MIRFGVSLVFGLFASFVSVCTFGFVVLKAEIYPFYNVNNIESIEAFYQSSEIILTWMSIIIAPVCTLIGMVVSRLILRHHSIVLSLCIAFPFLFVVFTKTFYGLMFIFVSVIIIFVFDYIDSRIKRKRQEASGT